MKKLSLILILIIVAFNAKADIYRATQTKTKAEIQWEKITKKAPLSLREEMQECRSDFLDLWGCLSLTNEDGSANESCFSKEEVQAILDLAGNDACVLFRNHQAQQQYIMTAVLGTSQSWAPLAPIYTNYTIHDDCTVTIDIDE